MKKPLVLSLLVLTLVACGKSDNRYPATVVTNFMNSCQAPASGNPELCSCVIEKLQEKLTIEEFTKLDTRMALGDKNVAKQFADIVAPCRK